MKFWGFHVRGEAENLSDIQDAVFQLLSSEGKRNSILQMAHYLRRGWNRHSFAKGQNILHIIAANRLAVLSRQLLDIKLNHETYSN